MRRNLNFYLSDLTSFSPRTLFSFSLFIPIAAEPRRCLKRNERRRGEARLLADASLTDAIAMQHLPPPLKEAGKRAAKHTRARTERPCQEKIGRRRKKAAPGKGKTRRGKRKSGENLKRYGAQRGFSPPSRGRRVVLHGNFLPPEITSSELTRDRSGSDALAARRLSCKIMLTNRINYAPVSRVCPLPLLIAIMGVA